MKDRKNEEKGIGRVSLVGAGCGSREWITLQGLLLLKSCDVVVYDDLIDETLLDEAPPEAERIYVGKRSCKRSASQEDIQDILISRAKQKLCVVRLKGGDPFVFGRGAEEIQALNEQKIPWNVVPGISSAFAIPAEAGIPVTCRGISRSVHIMTARTKDEVLRGDIAQFAELPGTLVFLMGLESLEAIADILIANGRNKDTPAAVLSGGNAACHYKITGTLAEIAGKVKMSGACTPAVIVVGDVAALDLKKEANQPLSHRRVGLTGTDDFQAKLRTQLLTLGAEPVSLMRGKCVEQAVPIPFDRLFDGRRNWIVFTSVQGIRVFFRKCAEARTDYRAFGVSKFAVIGKATKEELEKYGFFADVCPEEYTSSALAEAVLSRAQAGESVYLFVSGQGTDILERKLTEKGIAVRRFDLYDTQFTCRTGKEETGPLDYILFGSAGGVRALRDAGFRINENTKAVCIGPVCGGAYRSAFGKEPVIAASAEARALLDVLLMEEQRKERK